jgi:hypothetical protein
VAEWLGSGLQSRVLRFESGRRLYDLSDVDRHDRAEYGRALHRRLALGFILLALGIGAAQASSASSAPRIAGKTCSAGYVQANLSWGEKCLRAGEFCKVGNSEYRRYGFACPTSGHLTRATSISTPLATSHPATATAKCNDGTFSYAAHHSGSCSHHGGVAVFYS